MKFDEMFQKGASVTKPAAHPRRETKWIHYTKLRDNEKQYRKRDMEDIVDLARLIEASGGVLQNILVKKQGPDEYEIVAGHHRRKACQYLVEKEGKKAYEFLPCTVENISGIQAEFQLYSSNRHLPKTDYELMHELERMKELLETYPEEFPEAKGGRMVERLAGQMQMKRSTVGEYLTIAKNLGSGAMSAFQEGSLKKSAALEMASLPHAEQEALLQRQVTGRKEIRAYKEKKQQEEGRLPQSQPEEAADAPLPGQMHIADYKDVLPEGQGQTEERTGGGAAGTSGSTDSVIRMHKSALKDRMEEMRRLYEEENWKALKKAAEAAASECACILEQEGG